MTDVNETAQEDQTPFTLTTEKGTAEAVFASIAELLHSENIEVLNVHSPLNPEEAIQAQVVIGSESEDGHTLVCTYGLGSVETEARAKIDEEELPLRVELFAVAANREEAQKLAGELAELIFHTNNSKTPLLPGTIVGQEGLPHYAVSTTPYGTLNNHGVKPVRNPKYLVSFFAVNRITQNEAKLLSEQENAEEFFTYFNNLGVDAYRLERPEFAGE